MASQRQRQIIELLQSHKTGLSGNDLSNFLGVSSRTIRTDIKALEGELQAYGAAIHANTRNGYSLEITDEALFAAFIGEAAQGRMVTPGSCLRNGQCSRSRKRCRRSGKGRSH